MRSWTFFVQNSIPNNFYFKLFWCDMYFWHQHFLCYVRIGTYITGYVDCNDVIIRCSLQIRLTCSFYIPCWGCETQGPRIHQKYCKIRAKVLFSKFCETSTSKYWFYLWLLKDPFSTYHCYIYHKSHSLVNLLFERLSYLILFSEINYLDLLR